MKQITLALITLINTYQLLIANPLPENLEKIKLTFVILNSSIQLLKKDNEDKDNNKSS